MSRGKSIILSSKVAFIILVSFGLVYLASRGVASYMFELDNKGITLVALMCLICYFAGTILMLVISKFNNIK